MKDILAIVAITLALLAGLEGISRIFWPQTTTASYLHGASILISDPTLGWVNRPCTHAIHRTPEFTADYHVNQYGFRDASVHQEVPGSALRILLLGDSFTFGHGGNYSDIWPVISSNELNHGGHPVELVNAGVPGYDTRQEVLLLERLVPKYHPDLVVIVFLPNDLFTNATTEAPVPQLEDVRGQQKSSLAEMWSMVTHLNIVELAKRMSTSNDYLYDSVYMLTPRAQYFTKPPSARLREQIQITEQLLDRGSRFCREAGTRLAILSLPQSFQVFAGASAHPPQGVDTKLIDATLSEFARDRGIPWIAGIDPMISDYKLHHEDLFYRMDGHLTPAGNRLVAKLFAEELIKRGLLVQPTLASEGHTTGRSITVAVEPGCGPDDATPARTVSSAPTNE